MRFCRCAVLVVFLACWACVGTAQTEWVIGSEPVFEPGPPGSFDAGEVWPGTVLFDGSLYHMYYVGQPVADGPFFDGWQIGHATSTDGLNWNRDAGNPVVAVGAPGEWDERSLSKPAVAFDGTSFRMWFVGGNTVMAAAGYATSEDGSVWTKHPSNPILEPGPAGGWEGNALAPHTVLHDGDGYRMWYYAGPSLEELQIGFAESPDGLTWTKNSTPVVSPGRPGSWDSQSPHEPAVIFDGAHYHMWYTGIRGSTLSIGYARSEDGVTWHKHVSNPVVALGSLAISSTVLHQDGVYHMWFAGADAIYHATSAGGSLMTTRQFIPAAAYASGVGGAFYQTDVDVSNTDGSAVDYRFQWLPRGESNADPLTSGLLTLAPGASVRYANLLGEVFGLDPPALGGVTVEASSARLVVMSRTYTIDRDGAGGTYGQVMPAVPEEAMIGSGERRRIVFGSEGDAFRTNIGCQNANLQGGLVNVELLDQQGHSLARRTVLLPPLSNTQLNRVFEDFRPINGVVDVWSDVPGASFYCYGSVLDNVTSDPTTIPPQ